MSGRCPWKLANEMQPSHSGIYQKQYIQITLHPPSLNLTRYTQQMRFQPALNKTFSPKPPSNTRRQRALQTTKIKWGVCFSLTKDSLYQTLRSKSYLLLRVNDPRPLDLYSGILTTTSLWHSKREYSKTLYTQNPIPVVMPCCHSTSLARFDIILPLNFTPIPQNS